MPELIKDKGGTTVAAGAFPWNGPKKALNPYLDPAEVAPVSALSNLITLYAADNEQEQLRREALSNEVWERYFYNESRDPVQREMEQEQLLSRAKMAREQQQFNPDLVIVADVSAQPAHISKPLLERIKYFEGLGKPKAYSRYLRETIRPCLKRLERVRTSQVSASFRFMASHDGLEGLLILPEMNQEQVKRLSTLVAAHMSMRLEAACGELFTDEDVTPEEIRRSWERVAAEAMRLDVIPPAFEQLCRKKHRRKPVPYELIPGSLARMLCADWWYRKLWQMRCEWREEQLRAICLVNKKASPYVSYEAVIHKREQRRKSLEFFRSHELVNAEGDTLELEEVVIDYAALVEGGARMGVTNQDDPYEDQKRDLLAFASTAAKAATAFELPADELAEGLGKIASLYKVPTRNIEQLGDALNYLDDNAMSKGADIIDVLQRMGGVADRLDFRKAAALGSTFLSLGAAPEVAASAANAMVRELSIATMQSDRFMDGMDMLKLKPRELEKQMAKDAMGTILRVMEKVQKLPQDKRLSAMTMLFGKEFGDDAAKLANNLPELRRQLQLTAGNSANGSMQKESDINKDSLSAQWMLVKAGAQNAFSSLGETLR